MAESNIPEEFSEKYPDSVVKERFRRIWEKVDEQWGTQECVDFLDELVVMEDDKKRQGFDLNVMSELLHLAEMHNRAFPQFAVPKLGDDVWETDFTHN
jgi:hypothetical protein